MTTSTTSRERELRPSSVTTTAPSRPLAHIAGLDGLRAVAIAAVLVFHLDATWLPGGYLGVDIFFVVSGFLITSLLVREHRASGRIAFSQFWVRRARRLLPALVLCVSVSVLIARTVNTDLLVGAGRQVLGALTFSTNWVEITAGSSYFDQTAPALFMNFWSLAVEEQFYLFWPLVTLGLLTFAGRRLRIGAALGLGAASALLMGLLSVPSGDSTRAYYGTDTHLFGLMIGAALAFAYASPRLALRLAPSQWGAGGRFVVPGALAVLVGLLSLLDESSALTFRGGIVLASAATAVLMLGILDRHPGRATWWQAVTAHPALRWVGQRSYSLYLWHWPVILLVASDHPTATGTLDRVLVSGWCIVVTLALADLSFRFVETPVRRDGFAAVGAQVLARVAGWSRPARQLLAAGVVVTVALTAFVLSTSPDQSRTALVLEANEAAAAADAPDSVTPSPSASASAGPSASPPTGRATPSPPVSAPAAEVVPPDAAKAEFTMPSGPEIDAYGDSIMVGSLQAMKYYFPGIRIDAKSNRRWTDGLAQVRARSDNRRAVVLAFGTNWGVDADEVRSTLDVLGPDRMVVLVNLMGPMSRISKDNATLASIAAERPNVAVADWASAVRNHPDQLQSDRTHPSLTGAHLFAKSVRQALADLSERHTGQKVALKDLPVP